jgi:hypothetical protein
MQNIFMVLIESVAHGESFKTMLIFFRRENAKILAILADLADLVDLAILAGHLTT